MRFELTEGYKPSSVFKLLGLTLYWALLTFSKPYIPLQNNALKLYFVLCSLFMLSLYRLQIAYELQCKKRQATTPIALACGYIPTRNQQMNHTTFIANYNVGEEFYHA